MKYTAQQKHTGHDRPGRVRASYAQNFFRSSQPVRELVAQGHLQGGDIVYDLGAGTGVITEELLRKGARVVAVERDANLARKLRERFTNQNVVVLEQDLREVRYDAPFKIVANIPFNLTAATLKRLLFASPHPNEVLLVVQREAARKYSGVPRETEVSLKAKPWFELSIVQTFRPTDFVPAPNVEVVLLRICQRGQPLLDETQRSAWHAFVEYAFGRSKPNLKLAFNKVFSNMQWKRLAADQGFAVDATLTGLTLEQWIGLFRFFLRGVSREKRDIVMRATVNG